MGSIIQIAGSGTQNQYYLTIASFRNSPNMVFKIFSFFQSESPTTPRYTLYNRGKAPPPQSLLIFNHSQTRMCCWCHLFHFLLALLCAPPPKFKQLFAQFWVAANFSKGLLKFGFHRAESYLILDQTFRICFFSMNEGGDTFFLRKVLTFEPVA